MAVLAANRRPFLFVPLRHHFEQTFHVAHRLARYGAGRRLDYEDTAPERLAGAISAEVGRPTSYVPVATDGAIAFAVSWNPFVKSKASATTTTIARMAVSCIAPVSTTHRPASKRRSTIEA